MDVSGIKKKKITKKDVGNIVRQRFAKATIFLGKKIPVFGSLHWLGFCIEILVRVINFKWAEDIFDHR